MLKIIISGCNGKMGQVVSGICEAEDGVTAVAGFDVNPVKRNAYPVYAAPMEYAGSADVVVDFSNPAALTPLLAYCIKRKLPAVLCTTGYSPAQLEEIKAAAERIPVFKSANMSLGVNVLLDLCRRAAKILGGGYDVEIVERHHNRKVDAPSGTAVMIADAISAALPYEPEYVYDRHSVRKPRGKTEIGISAVRGGTIVGEHEVLFCGRDEVIEIKHSALSREVFAAGAVRAAAFLAGQKAAGLYTMADLVASV